MRLSVSGITNQIVDLSQKARQNKPSAESQVSVPAYNARTKAPKFASLPHAATLLQMSGVKFAGRAQATTPKETFQLNDVEFDTSTLLGAKKVLGMQDYLNEILSNPGIVRNTHQRTYDMIAAAGTKRVKDLDREVTSYNFFTNPVNPRDALVGIEEPIDDLVQHIKQAAMGTDAAKRLIMLVGGPGSAKSTLVRIIREGMERYTKSDEGALYALKWVNLPEDLKMKGEFKDWKVPEGGEYEEPTRIDPIYLLPKEARKKLQDQLNTQGKFEYKLNLTRGQLPAPSQKIFEALLEHEAKQGGPEGAYQRVLDKYAKAVRITIDETNRVGVGRFEARDDKSLDATQLVGGVNIAKATLLGDSHPMAFDYRSGEFFAANRGIMEFVEALKLDKEFLYLLLSLNEERIVKPDKQPAISVDELVFAHSNIPEYEAKKSDPEMDAVMKRMKIIQFPYNIKLDNEVEIYRRVITQPAKDAGINIAPHTLRTGGVWTLASRMKESANQQFSEPLPKILAYNGEISPNKVSTKDIRALRDEGVKLQEGLSGISPREMQNILPSILTHDGIVQFKSVDGYALISLIRQKLDKGELKMDGEELEKAHQNLEVALKDLDDHVMQDVTEAVAGDQDRLNNIFVNYIENVRAYVNDDEVLDRRTNTSYGPDKELMENIEKEIGIVGHSASKSYREKLNGIIGARKLQEEGFELDINKFPDIKKAIVQYATKQIKDVPWEAITSTKQLPPKQDEFRNMVINNLIKKGYDLESARHALARAGKLKNK